MKSSTTTELPQQIQFSETMTDLPTPPPETEDTPTKPDLSIDAQTTGARKQLFEDSTKDNIKHLHEDSKAAVLAANSRFYYSFRKGDLAAMQALWSKSENVCIVHPGVSGISGYELVMGSWEFVWVDYEFPLSIEVKDVQVQVRGDVGCVTCVEMVRTTGKSWGSQFATNVFEKIDGQWFICIHHASHVDL